MEKYCTAGQATDDNIIRHGRIACWITKATFTHLEYVIKVAFPLQIWLKESLRMLRYTVCPLAVLLRLQAVFSALRS